MVQVELTENPWPGLARAAQQAPAALEALLARARPLVHALILDRVRRPEAAEDLTQEALADLVRGLPGLRDPGAVLAWLRQIALNRCRMYWRRQALEYALPSADHGGLRAEDAYTVTARREMWRQLRRALEELPEPSRLALLMHVLEDCPYREIAAALGESEVGVRVRVHRARQRLRQLLRPSFYDPEDK
ncbi:MAG: sigma-70 family RNA polymerase sigma factor [Armatimonadetes bacterium]|nr:sigma-70 family RNA polymerase sigma factor [Armatimonadota bacterium]